MINTLTCEGIHYYPLHLWSQDQSQTYLLHNRLQLDSHVIKDDQCSCLASVQEDIGQQPINGEHKSH